MANISKRDVLQPIDVHSLHGSNIIKTKESEETNKDVDIGFGSNVDSDRLEVIQMNVEKINFALNNGTDHQRRQVLDEIHKLNLISEAVWHETQTNQNAKLKPKPDQNQPKHSDPDLQILRDPTCTYGRESKTKIEMAKKTNKNNKKRNSDSSVVLTTEGAGIKETIEKSKVALSTKSKSSQKITAAGKKRKQLESSIVIGVGTTMRNLMERSINDMLITFPDHEEKLKQIYDEEIKQLKRHYKRIDLPDMIALDIVNIDQLRAMANLAEIKLAKEGQHNSTDVIFDAILPEWAIAQFGKELNITRTDAVQKIKKQNEALIDDLE